MQNRCAELKLMSERRAGYLLIEMCVSGTREKSGDYQKSHCATTPNLRDLGISKTQSCRWQALSGLPDELFEKFLHDAKLVLPVYLPAGEKTALTIEPSPRGEFVLFDLGRRYRIDLGK